MTVKKLDLSALNKALISLDEALNELKRQPDNKFIRDATIQRFEYTYELSHKMLRRYLEMSEANPGEIDQMSFPTLIRTGSEKKLLLHGWDVWTSYRDARNMTSHVYDEKKAVQVVKIIPDFYQDAAHLFATLERRLAQS